MKIMNRLSCIREMIGRLQSSFRYGISLPEYQIIEFLTYQLGVRDFVNFILIPRH
jgi:hypothetical protein